MIRFSLSLFLLLSLLSSFNFTIGSSSNHSNSDDLELSSSNDDSPIDRLLLSKSSSIHGCGLTGLSRIANGKDTMEGDYPFIALVFHHHKPWGGSVIISDRWLITAAHHFERDRNPKNFTVGVGSIYLNQLILKKIDNIFINENFTVAINSSSFKYDIALIKLQESLEFGHTIRPICLPKLSFETYGWKKGFVIGWGHKKFTTKIIPNILQQVELDVITTEQCREMYKLFKEQIDETQICTYSINKDACTGDSGGPFFTYINNRATLYGIVSFGVTCADNYPGVYTAVFYYLDWIYKIIKEN